MNSHANSFVKFNQDKLEINGPVNVLRLEGEIDGNHKVIYLFADYHADVSEQTECSNIYATDVNKYLGQTFHRLNNSDRVYDFFMEMDPRKYETNSVSRNSESQKAAIDVPYGRYIDQVSRLVLSTIEKDPETNQSLNSKIFRNVRLHYADIRSDILEEIHNFIPNSLHILADTLSNIFIFQRLVSIIHENINQMINLLDNFKKIYEEISADRNTKALDNSPYKITIGAMRKLLHDYKHTNVQKKITQLSRNFCEEIIATSDKFKLFLDDVDSAYDQILNPEINSDQDYEVSNTLFVGKIRQNILDLFIKLRLLMVEYMNAHTGLTECYLMRRILDKDYITNAIAYSGRAHTAFCVEILLKYFDFDITHIAYSRVPIVDLKSSILEAIKNGKPIHKFISNFNAPQCSDMTDFPPDFM